MAQPYPLRELKMAIGNAGQEKLLGIQTTFVIVSLSVGLQGYLTPEALFSPVPATVPPTLTGEWRSATQHHVEHYLQQ